MVNSQMHTFKPKSKAQEDFFNLEMQGVFEIGFGGTPYSGKTCCMVVSSLMYAHIPEYRAAFFRREATQLEKAGLIDEAKNWYFKAFPTVEYDSVKRIFKFPSGALISFNGCEGELDYKKYDGVEWHALYFEELTHFTPDQITNLMSRVRNPKGKIPLRVRSSTNPGGPNEDWVINRYRPWLNKYTVDPLNITLEAQNGDILYYTNLEGQLVLSRIKDAGYKSISYICPNINDLSPDQEARVHGISDPIRRAALLGKWGVKAEAGLYFTEEWFKECDQPNYGANKVILRYWDLAASGDKGDFLASTLISKYKENYYIEDIVLLKPQVHEVESIIYKYAREDGPSVAIGIEQEGGSAGKILAHNFETKLRAMGHTVFIDQKTSDRSTSSKEARAALISPLAKEGKIWLVNNTNILTNKREFIQQMVSFPVGKHDDIVDATTGNIYLLINKYKSNMNWQTLSSQQRNTNRINWTDNREIYM